VHAGEFLRLLKHLAPDEEKLYAEEVEEEIRKLKAERSSAAPLPCRWRCGELTDTG
jgi:hypothetical protein